ncbi:class I SAM-dependent methyltransferase [Paraburkholderia sp. A2WS-5]|uniref:methyltransferase domain-containing protein n=1 Tax=Paraburkholderia sp. A2WS-5 TaxID=3028372 RepID=UPI003B7BC63D
MDRTMHPNRLLPRLGTPGNGDAIELITTETAGGDPFNGWLSDRRGNIVGELKEFKFDFVHFNRSVDLAAVVGAPTAKEITPRHKTQFIKAFSDRFQYFGDWSEIDGFMKINKGRNNEAVAVIKSSAQRVDIQFQAHQWSGIAGIRANDVRVIEVDLFNQENSIPRKVPVSNPNPGQSFEIQIYATGKRNEKSYAEQVLIQGAVEYLDTLEMPTYQKIEPRNHGAPMSDTFWKYLEEVPQNGIALDIGGGKRQIADERYVNLEYDCYEEPDMFGDGQALPFKSNSVDLIYCTGVLEHVPDPMRAADEIHRVLKKDGHALVCVPFLQPLHNDPQHFFNATPFGVETLFSKFNNRRVWWVGKFYDIVSWIGREARLHTNANPADWDAFCAAAERMSSSVPYDRLKFIASATWIDGVKE